LLNYIILAASAIILCLFAGAYLMESGSADENEAVNMVNEGDREVSVKAGEEFTVSLKANATTGYQWVIKESDGLRLVKDWYVTDSTKDQHMCGVGGTQYFKFVGENPGEYRLLLEYARPWEDVSVSSYELSVTVL